MVKKMVPILAESLVWMWRMMKVGWSNSRGAPRPMEETQSCCDEGLRVLQLKLAQGHSDPAIGLSGPRGGNETEGRELPSAVTWKGPVSLAGTLGA